MLVERLVRICFQVQGLIVVVAMLERGGYMKGIGTDHVFRSKDDAFSGVFARLDRSICATCRARIFTECAGIPGPGPTTTMPPLPHS